MISVIKTGVLVVVVVVVVIVVNAVDVVVVVVVFTAAFDPTLVAYISIFFK